MGLTQDLFCKTTGYSFNYLLIGGIFDKYKELKNLEVSVDGFYVNKFIGVKDTFKEVKVTGDQWSKRLEFIFRGSLYSFTWGYSDWSANLNILPTVQVVTDNVIVILNGKEITPVFGVDFETEYP